MKVYRLGGTLASPVKGELQVLENDDLPKNMPKPKRDLYPISIEELHEYIAEMQKKSKIKTQLELIKECKRIPKISPPPVEFAELFNMCNKLGVVGVVEDKRPEGRHWDNLKVNYLNY